MTGLTHAGVCFQTGEANDKDVQVVELPIVDSLHPRPPYLPLAVPEDLADRLIRMHGDPAVWWVSQFVKYLIRPQPWLEKEIEEATRKLGFKHPVIGWVFSFLSSSVLWLVYTVIPVQDMLLWRLAKSLKPFGGSERPC